MTTPSKLHLRGVGASPGEAAGTVRLARSLVDLKRVRQGDVLVVRESNPAWTAGLLKAGALISEFGGIICHAAIVAREMGIPCVVDIERATVVLRDGMRVRVDGTEGVVNEL